jgi:acetylornithine/N-succinyldiaminopimelate aminotransferase
VYDVQGNEYLDCVAGIATCTLGHADKRIVDAVCEQVRKLGHVSNLYYVPQQGHLASWLVSHSPADKVFFCNSGAEANEAAIKLVRKYWHTRKGATMDPATGAMPVIITAHNSFHGRTLATITATGQPKYHANFGPLMPGFEYVTYNCVDELRAAARRIGDNLAGIMMEAMQGEGGVRPGTSQFFSAAREICDASDALLVCDEVQVGVGRTGKLWGFENLDVTPDIFTVAKGLGGGVPIGAMLCKDSCDVFGPGDHASTFGGNPLASAAALAVTGALDNDGVIDNVIARGEQLRAGLASVAARYPSVIVGIRGWGLINGVELSPAVTAISVVKTAMASGLLLVPAGATVVRFVPPLVITHDEVCKAISMFEAAVATVLAA